MRTLIFVLLSVNLLFAQQYHKVELNLNADELQNLQQQGVSFDHYEYKNGKIKGDFSDWELRLIRESGVNHQVLLRNVSEHYQNQTYYTETESRAFQGCLNDFMDSSNDPTNYYQGTNNWYLTYNETLAELDKMRQLYPNIISAKQPINALRTHEGRPIYWVRISDNPDVDENENEGLITGIHHAREIACVTTCTYFMWYVLENYATDINIKKMVDNSELYIVLNLNPDGYVYNETTNPGGGGMWRKNRRNNGDGTFGVDLNRNYGYEWGLDSGSSPNTGSEVYRGEEAFSEPETQMIRDFCNAHQFKLALNFHTFSDRLIHPWGFTSANVPDYDAFVKIGEELTRDSYYYYATAPFAVGYSVSGSSDDWMYGEEISKPKILAFTPEVGAAELGFWPARNFILPYARQNLKSLLNFTNMLSGYFDVEENSSLFINTLNPTLEFNLKNYSTNTNTNSLSSVNYLSSNISSNGILPQNILQNAYEVHQPTLTLNLSSGIPSGALVSLNTNWSNPTFAIIKNIKKYYNINTVIKTDNANDFSHLSAYNLLQISNAAYHSAPSSFKVTSQTGMMSTSRLQYDGINLNNCSMAFLEFYAKTEATSKYEQLWLDINGDIVCLDETKKGLDDFSATYGNSTYWGTTVGFKRFNVDLEPYIGEVVNISINVENYQEPRGTWYIDDVKILKQTTFPAGVFDNSGDDFLTKSITLTNENIDISQFIKNVEYLQLTDITGRVISTQHSTILNTIDIAKGNYFLRVKTKEKNITLKCVRL